MVIATIAGPDPQALVAEEVAVVTVDVVEVVVEGAGVGPKDDEPTPPDPVGTDTTRPRNLMVLQQIGPWRSAV